MNETLGKLQAEKAYYADQCGTQAQTPLSRECSENATSLPLREQLKVQRDMNHRSNQALNRAIDILQSHPEFEDFIWLWRSGLV